MSSVGTYRAALDVCDRPLPEDPYSAKFSLQHCVAIALDEGRVDQASFDAGARGRIADERARVKLAAAPAIDAAYPGAWGASITVETPGGRTVTATRREAKGDPENPVTASELADKAHGLLVAGGMAEPDARAFVDVVLGLVDDRPIRSLGLFPRSADFVRRT